MAPIVIPPLITPVAKPLTMPRKHPALLDQSCVAYYDFSRGPKLQDFSGKGNHGTITGATFVAKGKHGPALSFDGTDDFVDCGNDTSIDINPNGSIEIDMHILTGGRSNPIIQKDSGSPGPYVPYAIWISTSNQIQLQVGNGTTAKKTILSNITLSTNTFYSIVCTFDNTNGKIYVNGAIDKTEAHGITPGVNTKNLWIGKGETNWSIVLIEKIRLYNRTLNANEIKRLYETGR